MESHPAFLNSPFLHYGVGAFETMRAIAGRLPLWDYHRQRLTRALEAWGCGAGLLDDLERALRPAATSAPLEKVKVIVGLMETGHAAFRIFREAYVPPPRSMRLLALREDHPMAAGWKSCNRERHFFAKRRAQASGCDDVLYLTRRKNLLETSAAAIHVLSADHAASASGPILDSISRRRLLEHPSGFFAGARISLDDIRAARPLLLTNALRGIFHASEIVWGDGAVSRLPAPAAELVERFETYLFGTKK